MALSAQSVTSTVFRDSSYGEEHDTSQTPTSQFWELPRSMGRENFSEIGVCIVLVELSRGIFKCDVEAI